MRAVRGLCGQAAGPSNVAAWKLRVGSVLIALNASRLASVPSSRYFAVAGPNDRSRRSRANASTSPGCAVATLVAARTAIALRFFAPMTAPSPPRPACRPSCEIVAYRTPASPAADLPGRPDRGDPPAPAELIPQLGVRAGRGQARKSGRIRDAHAVAVDEQHGQRSSSGRG